MSAVEPSCRLRAHTFCVFSGDGGAGVGGSAVVAPPAIQSESFNRTYLSIPTQQRWTPWPWSYAGAHCHVRHAAVPIAQHCARHSAALLAFGAG
jgi:hypothetical protein